MINTTFFDDLSIRIKGIIDNSPAGDMERNLRALLQGAFTKLELVSREEFDIQADILRLTRQKLELLEIKLEKLELLLHKNNNQDL